MQLRLKNSELLDLQLEISDFLTKTDDIPAQFYTIALHEKATEKLKTFIKMREEMYKKYGESQEDGSIKVTQYQDEEAEEKVETENYIEFLQKHRELLEQELSIDYEPIPLSIFTGIKSSVIYPKLRKFINIKV